jgi:hypothetical protein
MKAKVRNGVGNEGRVRCEDRRISIYVTEPKEDSRSLLVLYHNSGINFPCKPGCVPSRSTAHLFYWLSWRPTQRSDLGKILNLSNRSAFTLAYHRVRMQPPRPTGAFGNLARALFDMTAAALSKPPMYSKGHGGASHSISSMEVVVAPELAPCSGRKLPP